MQLLTLTHGAMRCELLPALGGAITGLWFEHIAVLRPPPSTGLASVREASSYPLLPFSNRIGQARMQWDGVSYALAPNFAPEPHAVHGVGWQRPWAVSEKGPDFAQLSLQHVGDSGWPFAFDGRQTLQLHANALELKLVLTNRAGHAAPLGLGWHPYFAKRPGSRITFAATGRWEMGPDKLPTHRLPMPGLQAPCATLEVDHCFDGWSGIAQLQDDCLRSTLSSDLDHLVVFTHPSRDFVAIEPVSHVNNALNLAGSGDVRAFGLQVLEPGQSMTAQMRITVQAT